jgi:hypothetical protein
MNLQEASKAALEAARCRDLDALAAALKIRQQALDAGEQPTQQDLYWGEQAAQFVRELVRGHSHVDIEG